MSRITITKKYVEKILKEFGPVSLDRDGVFYSMESDPELLDYLEDADIPFDQDEEGDNSLYMKNEKAKYQFSKMKIDWSDIEKKPIRQRKKKKTNEEAQPFLPPWVADYLQEKNNPSQNDV